MFDIEESSVYAEWCRSLRDRKARGFITARLFRLANGNIGDARPVGDGVSELRLHFGPGYRIYFTRRDTRIVFLLCGGDKGSQSRDVARAKQIASGLE